jgi:predicted TIM-barrel fold metal-dependent hydrolase
MLPVEFGSDRSEDLLRGIGLVASNRESSFTHQGRRAMSGNTKAGLSRPKIDVHCHVGQLPNTDESSDALVACGDALGVVEMWCSIPVTGGRIAPMEEIRKANDSVLHAMARHSNRIRGLCFVIPGYHREALAEVERGLDAGMTGVKLYNQYTIDDPVMDPLLELSAEWKFPILMHAGYLTAPEDVQRQPRISHGVHFAAASERHPDAVMIHAHIGGGGDWERSIRAMRDTSPNLYCDTSGSNLDDGQIEMAVAEMGANRVLFGSDGTMSGCVGKVLGARISEADRELIFRGNAARILAARGMTAF